MVDFTQPQERSDDASSQYDQGQFPENSDWDRIAPEQDRPRQPYYEYQGAKRRPSQDWGTPNQANQFAENYGPAMPQGPYWPTMQQMPNLMKSTMADISTFSLPMQRGSLGAMQSTLAYMKAYKAAYDKERDAAPKRELEQMSIALKKLAIETDAQNREYHDILAGTDPGSDKQHQQLYTAAAKHQDHYLQSLLEEGNYEKATHVLAERDKYSQDWQNMQKAADAHLKDLDERGAAADRREEHQWKKEDRGKEGPGSSSPENPPLEDKSAPEFRPPPQQEQGPQQGPQQEEPQQESQKGPEQQQQPEEPPTPEQPSTPGPAPLQGRQPSPLRRPTERPAAPAAEQQQGELEQPQDQDGQQPTRLAQADIGTASDAPQPGAQRVAQAAPPPAQQGAPSAQQGAADKPRTKSLDDFAAELGAWAGVSAEQVKQDSNETVNGRNVYRPTGNKQQREAADRRNEAAHKYAMAQGTKLQEISGALGKYRDTHPSMTTEEETQLRDWGLKQINDVDWRLGSILPAILRGDKQMKSYAYASLAPRIQLTQALLERLDPNWSEHRYVTKGQAMTNFSGNGMWATRMASAATSLQHSAVLYNAVQALDPSDYRSLNKIKNWADTETGSGRVVALRGAVMAWAQELAKAFRGNQSSLHEVQEILNNVSPNSSKQQFMDYIRTMDGLLMGQVKTGTSVWNNATGDTRTPEQMLQKYADGDTAVRWLKVLQGDQANFEKGQKRYRSDDGLRDPVEQALDSENSQAYQWYIKHKYWDPNVMGGPDPEAHLLEPIRRKLQQEGFQVK